MPSAEGREQRRLRLGTKVGGAQAPGEGDGPAELLDVIATVGADVEVQVEPGLLGRRERVLEVVGHELHELAAGELGDGHRQCRWVSAAAACVTARVGGA